MDVVWITCKRYQTLLFDFIIAGYFHKAVLQSGTNFDIWAVGEKSVVLGRTEKIGKLVNCSKIGENWKPLIDCLRTRSAVDVASTIKKLFVSVKNFAKMFSS